MTRARFRPLFPGAALIEGCRLLISESGSPALFLRTLTAEQRPQVYRLPDGVALDFLPGEGRAPLRAVFSSPEGGPAQRLEIHAARVYAALLEGVCELLEARQTVPPLPPSADLPGAGYVLKTARALLEGDRPALYLGADSPDFRPTVYRVGAGCRLTLEAPDPLPEETDRQGKPRLLKARAVLEGPQGRAVLSVPSVRAAREVLEALTDCGQTCATREAGQLPGEEQAGPGVGAA